MRLTAWGARRLVKSALEAPTCDLALIRRRMGIRRWLPSVLPSGLTVTPTTLGGVRCDWLTPRGARTDRAIVYFHGGGYIGGSARSMRALAAWVAAAARTPVCAVEYRLAPEHPFPAAFDDAMAVYGAVLAAGIAPARLGLLGDSAGGGLAVAAMLAARDRGVPLPAAAALISPWLDLTWREDRAKRTLRATMCSRCGTGRPSWRRTPARTTPRIRTSHLCAATCAVCRRCSSR